jgi:formate dehydrogenase/NADH-quinone oxidoreductase subunit F
VGWKFFAVSGHVEQPDVYCVPMGTTVGTLIDMAGGVSGGRSVGAVQPGGRRRTSSARPARPAARLRHAAEGGHDARLGALVVLAEGTDLLAASTNVLRFFRNESCGKCVPCRVGSTKAHELLRGVVESGPPPSTTSARPDPATRGAMRKTSICGLGQVALGPVASVLGLDKGGAQAGPAQARRRRRPTGQVSGASSSPPAPSPTH